MPCFYPLIAWRSRDLDDISSTGKHKLVFKEDLGFPNTKMEIACGQCSGCRLDRARAWAVRCMHEAKLHPANCFLTLTYNEAHVPESLNKRDIQLFLKRLRKRFPPKSIRFFQCGEYGDQLGRPHHHVLVFGTDFPDRLLLRGKQKNKLYTSQTVSDCWPFGFHSIGALDFDSACYVARYVLKKITGDAAEDHYAGRLPEFITMSRRPGIGFEWYQKFKWDLYRHDHAIMADGMVARPPKYYDNLFKEEHGPEFRKITAKRVQAAKDNPDNNPEGRARLEAFQKENFKRFNNRSYESDVQ